METSKSYRLKNPPHPGGFVKTEIIEPLKLSVTEAAKALGVTRPALSALLNGRSSLSPEMVSAYREGFRRWHGYAHANAEQLRYCPGSTKGKRHQGRTLPRQA